jgi:adenylate cyclase
LALVCRAAGVYHPPAITHWIGSMARRLAAILAADVVGYSRLMAADEEGTHARLKALRKEFIELRIAEHHGRIVKLTGDGALVEFGSVVEAVLCAVDVQRVLAERNAEIPADERLQLRIGVNLGDVIFDDNDIYGDGVNVAARLEGLAPPGGICVSRTVCDHVKNKVGLTFEPMGEHRVKNIAEPITVYRVITDRGPLTKVLGLKRAGTRRWRIAALAGAAVILLLVAAGGAGLWLRVDEGALPSSDQAVAPVTAPTPPALAPQTPLDRHRLAVLPFTNISADPEDEYFSDGMTEELISKLSRLRDLKVIARTSVMQYKATGKSVAEIGRELQVGTILEGSVRKAGEHLRITAQLVDVESQGHLWSQDYDRTLDDVFAIQSAVAESVADALEVTLGPSERRQLAQQGTQNLEAYHLYLQGLSLFHKMSEIALYNSIALFERALQLDPAFAEAYAGIAMAYLQVGYTSLLGPKDAFEKARSAAEKALELDDTVVDAQLAVANTGQILNYDQARAKLAYERAVELAPSSAVAHQFYGIMYLSPMGRHEEAIAQMQKYVDLTDGYDTALGYLGYAYGMAGQHDKALEILESLQDRGKGQYVLPYAFAPLYVGLGEKDKAIEALWRDYDERAGSHELLWLKVFPVFDPLRSDPRFDELLRKIGVEP